MGKFISNYEEACAKLGIRTELPDVSTWGSEMHKHLIAVHKLSTIVIANNPPGWVANVADTNQRKWYPYHRVIEDKEAPGGFRLSFLGSVFGYDFAFLGVRLASESSQLADFIGRECIDIYTDLSS
jgi:hypothetical protein